MFSVESSPRDRGLVDAQDKLRRFYQEVETVFAAEVGYRRSRSNLLEQVLNVLITEWHAALRDLVAGVPGSYDGMADHSRLSGPGDERHGFMASRWRPTVEPPPGLGHLSSRMPRCPGSTRPGGLTAPVANPRESDGGCHSGNVPETAVVADAIVVAVDSVRLQQLVLVGARVIPGQAVGGDGEIGPAVGDAEVAQVDMSGAAAV